MPDDETLRKLETLVDDVLEEALAVAFYLKARTATEERRADENGGGTRGSG